MAVHVQPIEESHLFQRQATQSTAGGMFRVIFDAGLAGCFSDHSRKSAGGPVGPHRERLRWNQASYSRLRKSEEPLDR